ncbi:glycosyl hydrolase 108 family protein [Luteimonas composti]|uniref:Glycosyl hydrolase 108 family protein n=1 Tax=Luteimonas composti TaxID=398257 RepID=A0ABT6MSH4_9GAMM|nr:glycosyl hydrolase 108 family protein [Luteimonas composti]MDH7453576.1 glycosyl hydrolase 108 family protein [Luteimonas composti]
MTDHFPSFIDRLLSHEGGYSSDRTDPGNWTGGRVGAGELRGTKFGIAANSYPTLDIKGLTRAQAIAIYRRDFWQAARCHQLPPVAAFQLLDGAVNSGIRQATRWLQRAVGVSDDGAIGPVTLAAIKAANPNDIVLLFNAERLDFMTRLSNWPHHGRGWARRIAANLRYAATDN